MLFSIFSLTENVQYPRVSLVNLWWSDNQRGQILVSRTGGATLRVVHCALCVVGVQCVGVGVCVDVCVGVCVGVGVGVSR